MTIDQIGSIGELIAAIATVATLVYLSMQLRQNTAAVRGSGTASHTDSQNAWSTLLLQDADLNDLYWRGLADRDALDERERRRFDGLLGMQLTHVQQTLRLHREGVIDPVTWTSNRSTLTWLMSEPGFQSHWNSWGELYDQDFSRMVEEVRGSVSPIGPQSPAAAQQSTAADSA